MLKTVYDNQEDIPAGYEALYTEKNGKWELTGVTGVKTQADVDRVQQALTNERKAHATTKESLKAFEGLDPETVHSQATELEETKAQLEAIKKDGTLDETKLEPIIAARVKQQVAPIERDKAALAKKLDDANKVLGVKDQEIGSLKTTIVTGNVERSIRDAAIAAKVLSTAVGDVVLRGSRIFELTEDNRIITKDNVGVTPGLTPQEWLKDEIEKSPHWWPASVGGGSSGAGGNKNAGYAGANNPWSAEGWNLTKQGALVKSLGLEKATALAESVGSKIGATSAPKKAA